MPETYIVQRLSKADMTLLVSFSSFADGDTHCVIQDAGQLCGAPVLVVHYLYPNQNEQLIRLLLLVDLLRDLGVKEVSVFCPYLPYSRQDKRHLKGEALGSLTVCRLLSAAGCKRLYAVDCHFMRGSGEGLYEGLQVVNIPATDLLLEMCRDEYLGDQDFHVVGPDKGASYLGSGSNKVGHHMHKTRGDYTRGDTVAREVATLSADHISLTYGATVVADDMISTGTTMLSAVEELRRKNSGNVYCVCTHGLFLGESYRRLAKATDGIIFGDTVPHPEARPIVGRVLNESVMPLWRHDSIASK